MCLLTWFTFWHRYPFCKKLLPCQVLLLCLCVSFCSAEIVLPNKALLTHRLLLPQPPQPLGWLVSSHMVLFQSCVVSNAQTPSFSSHVPRVESSDSNPPSLAGGGGGSWGSSLRLPHSIKSGVSKRAYCKCDTFIIHELSEGKR